MVVDASEGVIGFSFCRVNRTLNLSFCRLPELVMEWTLIPGHAGGFAVQGYF